MPSSRLRGATSVPFIILIILAGAILLSALFYTFWQRLNHQVEVILQDQFNQQQLMLSRKIADNVESYFDFLENVLMGYAGIFQTTPPKERYLDDALLEIFARHQQFGIIEIRRYDVAGMGIQVFSASPTPSRPGSITLPPCFLDWARNPAHRGRLYLSADFVYQDQPWQGRKVMRFLSPLYLPDDQPHFAGVLEFLVDPFFICKKVTKDVRSGQSGYAYIVDQDGTFLAHHEQKFVGQDALQVRAAWNPKIDFSALSKIQARMLAGEEGTGEYISGWHREQMGKIRKLVAYSPIRYKNGIIAGVTDIEDPAHNLWGVAVVAPVAEVSGSVGQVLHQALSLVGLFFIVVLGASGLLIGIALFFNKSLTRQVQMKTEELLASQERLVRSERFAAVGEAAAYVSHEIKNPLMVIGGLAAQVERHLPEDPKAREKLQIIQNEVKRLESFLGDLRDFLRPVQPCKRQVNLNQVIRDVEALMEEAIKEKGGSLEERLDPNLPPIEADPDQIKQVLVNLFKNATEAIEETGGKILVSSGSRDAQVWFAVQDMGKGMSDDVLENIFNPFFTTKAKGTGLGLAVINKIITDHQGFITVDSAVGKGSTFTVRLPQKGLHGS